MEFRGGAQRPSLQVPVTSPLRPEFCAENPKLQPANVSKISAPTSACAGECGAAGRRWQTNNKITWESLSCSRARAFLPAEERRWWFLTHRSLFSGCWGMQGCHVATGRPPNNLHGSMNYLLLGVRLENYLAQDTPAFSRFLLLCARSGYHIFFSLLTIAQEMDRARWFKAKLISAL